MADRTLGLALIGAGLLLGLVAVAWLAVNALAGILEPGGFVLGLFFLMLLILPLVIGGVYVLQRCSEREARAASFEKRRELLERDRIFRQTLQRQARRAAESVAARAAEVQSEISGLLHQAQRILEGLAEEAAQPVPETDWLHAAPLEPRDARDVERYDDLLLAGIRRVREEADGWSDGDPGVRAQRILELARSAERQFALRQELVLRGRRLPVVGPLQLLRAEIPARRPVAPDALRPGDAVSRGEHDYLVTAHVTYFAEGRVWHGFVLRGEEGELRLQVEPGADRALLMEPVGMERLPGRVVARGTASASVDSLSGAAEGVVVDYRLAEAEGDRVGWWERWPEGERAYAGERVGLRELQFWPGAVAAD